MLFSSLYWQWWMDWQMIKWKGIEKKLLCPNLCVIPASVCRDREKLAGRLGGLFTDI